MSSRMFLVLVGVLALLLLDDAQSFSAPVVINKTPKRQISCGMFLPDSTTTTTATTTTATTTTATTATMTHSSMIQQSGRFAITTIAAFLLLSTSPVPAQAVLDIPPQKSYSTNARNLDRLNAGDASGGSIYDNNPSQPAARRRRAMQGCKIASARSEAARVLDIAKLSEKDCNMQVMQSSPDFMLQALQTLDCPTCPYGIKP